MVDKKALSTLRFAGNKKPPERAVFLLFGTSEVVVVIGQTLLQAAFFEQIVDDAALGQVGLGDFDLLNGFFVALNNEVIVQFEFGFLGHESLQAGCDGAPYSDSDPAGKKDFFNENSGSSL
jgi:hypothetical protein